MQYTSPPNQPAYYEQVWGLVRQIPRGKVAAYGQIALMLPPPAGVEFEAYKAFGPRWVGGAMAACPDDVPWQRVINSQGSCSTSKLFLPYNVQQKMLEDEGVAFNEKGKCDLEKYRWFPEGFEPEADEQPSLFG